MRRSNRSCWSRVFAMALIGLGCGLSCEPASQVGGPGDDRVLWRVAGEGFPLVPSYDGTTVFFASKDHRVVAIDIASGAVRWQSATDGGPGGVTAGFNTVVAGDVVAVGDVDVYAFDRSTGARAWSFRASDDDETGTHALGTDGTTIYASSYLGRVYALDGHTGAPAWVTQLPGPPGVRVLTFDPVAAGGKIFVGLWYDTAPVTGGLAALDASTGQLLWTHEFTPIRPELESFCGGGAVAVDGVVVASSADGQIYGLDVATGAQRWVSPQIPNYDLDDLRALALSNGLVIASSSSGRATALDPATGAIRWLKVVSGASLAYQVSADDQLAVFGTNEVLAVDPLSGNVLWHTGDTQQSKKFFGYAAVGPDEVFANGVDGFYALRKR